MTRLLVWTPRVLAILFALFISLFALDVFAEGEGFWRTIAAFLIHLIPTAVILLALIVAWRRPSAGALLFAGLGLLYLALTRGRVDWIAILLIAGPAFLICLLFLGDWLYRRERLRPGL